MAKNVFGIPIDDEYLSSLPEYSDKKEISQLDRAKEALRLKNSQEKDTDVQRYLDNLKAEYGNGVSTKVAFYNATGATLELVTTKDWHGHIGQSPVPLTVYNGQWAGFLHVKTGGAAVGSTGAVVYRGLGLDGNNHDWMFIWSNPFARGSWDNAVYAEVRSVGHFQEPGIWDVISNIIDKRADPAFGPDGQRWIEQQVEDKGRGKMTITTGSDSTPIVSVTFTLQGL
ncbi:hypothetical protein HXX76_003837 [Chlamydomonas incerta]|uniref:23 kDa jasmonate-induced protein-like n=1 Tax=Chlamydomonas incerta TaxID=51695 RepID=A0A835W881_CHLIN|nr:hypothetical protein HXX76_003837 [Chlamydomonas incerta]|eukprot:KAG2440984.1 hypothetical protein HXX76_003837 [Chlamydomonas incerta]